VTGGATAEIGATSRSPGTIDTQRFSGRAMASPINLTTVVPTADPPTTTADRAWSAVVDEFEACEQALSRFRQMSAVTRHNQAAQRGEALSDDRRTAVAAHA
jgi:hypothetical protein